MSKPQEDLSGVPMLDLFRAEAENQAAALTQGLLELERGASDPACLEGLMRAAHSLKGAARLVNLRRIEQLAHTMEDCFEAARAGTVSLRGTQVDVLLRAVDILLAHSKTSGPADPGARDLREMDAALRRIATGTDQAVATSRDHPATVIGTGSEPNPLIPALPMRRPEAEERVLRLTPENLNRLLGLAGESLVESRWLRPFSDSLRQLKRYHMTLGEELDRLRHSALDTRNREAFDDCIRRMAQELAGVRAFLDHRVEELDTYDRRAAQLSQRLYLEVLRTRMRPFGDCVRRFPRMVRDLSRSLQKEIKLEITGQSTQVDREILERLETPLGHLLRNAVDHGCELPEARLQAGKPPEAVVHLDARPSAGVLLVTVSDDGAGVHLDELRRAVVKKRIVTAAQAERLGEAELLEFLFRPGFTLKQTVTEISGRGYGLDIVQNMVREVRGAIRLQNQPGRGLKVQLHLPLTLSVLRALLVETAGEPYAIPLNQVNRTILTPRSGIRAVENHYYLPLDGQQIPVCWTRDLLQCAPTNTERPEVSVVVLGDRNNRHGLIVDRFLGERELVVQALPAVLGKIKGVTAAALMENGAPVLILDTDDLLRSASFGARGAVAETSGGAQSSRQKRILIVDDSPTVRQIEQKMLTESGYLADAAADGVEAWNLLQNSNYDLVLTDLEMPRMDGLQLARLIKQDPALKKIPVLIISYKDRDEDRLRGLEAGADYYLTKGSFHDKTLLKAVRDLIQ